jgi:16S rRNA (guanine527-N7)-methyltransferase
MEKEKKFLIYKEAEKLGVEINQNETQKICEYLKLLNFWGKKINLTSNLDEKHIITHHLPDAFQLISFIKNENKKDKINLICDIGAGSGLIGIPLGIILNEATLSLVESNGKKCSFLRTIIHELKLNMQVYQNRIECLKLEKQDLAFSRATWNPNQWMKIGKELVKKRGYIVAFLSNENQKIEEEVNEYLKIQYSLKNNAQRIIFVKIKE